MQAEPPDILPYFPEQQWDFLFHPPSVDAETANPQHLEANHQLLEQVQVDLFAEDALAQPAPENVDEAHILALNAFLSQSVGEFLQNQLKDKAHETFAKELQNHLASCTAILNPPDYLQFLRKLAQDLTSDKDFFEINGTNPPQQLPIPVSLSHIDNNPLRITVQNPALRALLCHHFLPAEHSNYYKTLTEHVIKTLLIDTPEQLTASHTIIFRQLHLEYHLTLNLLQIIFLFFPSLFVEIAKANPEADFSDLLDTIFHEHRFGICDVRFDGMIQGSTPLVESLIVGDLLSTFPSQLMQNPALKEKVCSYLTLLIRWGISDKQPCLKDPIVLSICKLAGQVFESTQDLSQVALLYNYTYDALNAVKSRNAALAKQIQEIAYFQKQHPFLPHETYAVFTAKKATYFSAPPEPSFLLVDLLGICQSNTKRKEIQSNEPPAKIRKTETAIIQKLPNPLEQIWNLNRTVSKHFLQHIPCFTNFLQGKEESLTSSSILEQRGLLGSLVLQALFYRKSGLHLIVAPDFEVSLLRKSILEETFYEAIYSSWKITTQRANKEETLKHFVSILNLMLGQDPQYDELLLRSAKLFEIEKLLPLVKEGLFTRDSLKKIALSHLKKLSDSLFFQYKSPKVCEEVTLCVSQAITYAKKIPEQDKEFVKSLATWHSQNKKNTSIDKLLQLVEQLYTYSKNSSTPSSYTPVDRAFFHLTSLIVGIRLEESPLQAPALYPDSGTLALLHNFLPCQISTATNFLELKIVAEAIQKVPQLGQICIVGTKFFQNLVDLSVVTSPISTVIFHDATSYEPQIPVIKEKVFLIQSSMEQNTPSPFTLALKTKPWQILSTSSTAEKSPAVPKLLAKPNLKLPFQGFPNKNNTCFINSGLQALFSIPKFQELLKTPLPQDKKYKQWETLHKALNELLALHVTHNDLNTPLSTVLTELYSHVPDIKGQPGAFHDVTPILEAILEIVNYPLQWDETYRGLDQNNHLTSTTRRPLFVLPVPMKENEQLQELINQALSVEEVHDKNNIWKATNAEEEQVPLADYSTLHTLVEPLPDFIIIQLKRWRWDKELVDHIKDVSPIQITPEVKIGSCRFSLKACIHQNHMLMHYHADVKNNGKWYRCDDTSIEELDQPDAANAYVFVLEKIA